MVKAGVSDYLAVAHNTIGTTIAIEAKSYRHELPKAEISAEQQRHLNAVVLGGGLALLLVRIADDDAVREFCAPWQAVPWQVPRRSAEVVTAAELAHWRIPSESQCYLERYCPVRGVPIEGAGQRRKFPRE